MGLEERKIESKNGMRYKQWCDTLIVDGLVKT